jgi:hypothetical protein
MTPATLTDEEIDTELLTAPVAAHDDDGDGTDGDDTGGGGDDGDGDGTPGDDDGGADA